MNPTVFWFYGLSGAGKTTLSNAVAKALRDKKLPFLQLDGDELRAGLNSDLGFSLADRTENIRRAAQIARLACNQGQAVLAAFITPTNALRDLARSIVGSDRFVEIYLDCDYATSAARDVKGIYAKAASGELTQFTGKDQTFEPPATPDFVVSTGRENVEHSERQTINFVLRRIKKTPAPRALATPHPATPQIVGFLRDIGLEIEPDTLDDDAFLPGIIIRNGGIIYDETRMLYPGDLLHEAGHLAVMTSSDRAHADGNLKAGGGEEMAAIAWSYAAALHIGIDPGIVFHEHGYRKGSNSLLQNFGDGKYLGVPMLQWLGLAVDDKNAGARGVAPYPHMLRWLRE